MSRMLQLPRRSAMLSLSSLSPGAGCYSRSLSMYILAGRQQAQCSSSPVQSVALRSVQVMVVGVDTPMPCQKYGNRSVMAETAESALLSADDLSVREEGLQQASLGSAAVLI